MNELDNKKYGIRKDPELYNQVVNAYRRSKKFKEELGIMEQVEKYDLYYQNEPWKAAGMERAEHLSEMKIPIAFDVVETGLALVTARAPMPDVKPLIDSENNEELTSAMNDEESFQQLKDALSDYGEKLQRELVDIWQKTKMQQKQRVGYRENCKTGNSFLKSEYDVEKKKWINTVCDISTIFPTPGIETIEDHTEDPFIYAPVVSIEKVKKKYSIDDIEAGALGSYDDIKAFGNETSFLKKVKAAIQAGIEVLGSSSKNKDKGTHVILIECYMSDDTIIDVPVTDFDDKTGSEKLDVNGDPVKKTEQTQKFESGYKRVTVILDHRDWILEEAENPYKRPPFFGTINYRQAGSIYGIPELKAIEDLITIMNVSASNYNDNLRYCGNPKLGVVPGSKTEDGEEITNEIGGIVYSPQPNGVWYVNPPSLGHDIKWWLGEFLRGWLDRATHLSDAVRGFNQYSQDSGKKIRELLNAAHGSFQPKLDEQVDFIKELFQYWAFCIQNYYDHKIMQRIEDVGGKADYVEFNPAEGKGFKFQIDVSSDSILPDDPFAEFDDALILYDRGMSRTGEPLISPEHLIDLAVSLKDKQRAKLWLEKKEQQGNQQVFEEFVALAEQASDVSENEGAGKNEDNVVIQLIQLLTKYPQFLGTNEFIAMSERLRLAVLAGVAKERTRKQ